MAHTASMTFWSISSWHDHLRRRLDAVDPEGRPLYRQQPERLSVQVNRYSDAAVFCKVGRDERPEDHDVDFWPTSLGSSEAVGRAAVVDVDVADILSLRRE
jgi:hypothetical protein